jgi:hypothetical protein
VTGVGACAIIASLLMGFLAFIHPSKRRAALFLLSCLLHIGTSIVFYQYVQTNLADSALYYYDPFGYYEHGFGLSTEFVIFVVQWSKSAFGGTYFDYFLVFQAIGFAGIVVLMRIFEEICETLNVEQPTYAYLLLFMPGMHFWTSSIGKDGPLFFAACLAVWSVMHIQKRFIGFAAAVVLMILIRPHIAFIALASLAVTVVLDKANPVYVRTSLIALALIGAGLAAATIQNTFAVDVTSSDSVSDFLASREDISQDIDAGNTAVSASYPIKLLSLLFRPFFFDARDPFAYVASMENAVLLLIILTLLFHIRSLRRLSQSVAYIRFALIFSIGVTVAISMVYYNVGLGLRQKTMILPGLFAAFVSLRALLAAKHEEEARSANEEPQLA